MIKKINLGCGPVGKDDWINIDWGILAILHKNPLLEKLFLKIGFLPKRYNLKWPKNLMLRDLKKQLPFKDSNVDFIYISHVLEHFKKYEAERLAQECYRIMKKGALIRVVVPDLKLLAGKYVQGDIDYYKKIDELTSDEKGNKIDENFLLADILMNTFYPNFYRTEFTGFKKFMTRFVRPHCWMYDFESLKYLLKKAGFGNIKQQVFRKGGVPDIDQLDVFPEMSLYIEAEK